MTVFERFGRSHCFLVQTFPGWRLFRDWFASVKVSSGHFLGCSSSSSNSKSLASSSGPFDSTTSLISKPPMSWSMSSHSHQLLCRKGGPNPPPRNLFLKKLCESDRLEILTTVTLRIMFWVPVLPLWKRKKPTFSTDPQQHLSKAGNKETKGPGFASKIVLPNFKKKNSSSAFRLEGQHELFWSHEDNGRSRKRIHVGIYGKDFQTGKNGHGQWLQIVRAGIRSEIQWQLKYPSFED
jgi:hypothetical protein